MLSEKSRLKTFFAFWGIATVFAFLSIGIIISSEFASNYELISKTSILIFLPAFVDEFTGVYSFFLLIPILIYIFKTFPLNKNNFKLRLPAYLLISILIGLTHTIMMYVSRKILYPPFQLGEYDYGYIPYRIIMEYFKQLISFWAVFVVFTFIQLNREKEKEKIRAAKLEEQLTKSKLQALKAQLNPHFLFNTLNMISSVMYENPKAADKMISNLSDLLRAALSGSSKEFHSLKNEIDILNIYIEIMKARFGSKLNVVFNVNEKTSNASVPWFIFQPLVENSIKFCMNEIKPAVIEIISFLKNEKLFLSVKDNGPGFSAEAKALNNSGVGLANLVDRLENIYGKEQSFAINNIDSGGSEVIIEIPFELMKQTNYESN